MDKEERHQARLAYMRKYHKDNKERGHAHEKTSRLKARMEVLSHYSNGTPKCACCGEQHFEFLSIDHINGGGTKFRKENPGRNIYYMIRKEGFPEGYRVLCHNCNLAIGFYGKCPHGCEI